MKKIDIPNISNEQIFEDCLETVSSKVKEKHYEYKHVREKYEKEYISKVIIHKLHKIKPEKSYKELTKKELIYLYTGKLSKADYPNARRHYNLILSNKSNGNQCPYCNHRRVNQIDHYLPKAEYPWFSITLENLVPICSICNKSKLEELPQKSEEEIIHPYFDSVDSFNWLKLNIEFEEDSVLFQYDVEKGKLDDLTYLRIKNTLKVVKLYKDFAILANEEIKSIVDSILFNEDTINEQIKYAKEIIHGDVKRYSHLRNHWKQVFYSTLVQRDDLDDIIKKMLIK